MDTDLYTMLNWVRKQHHSCHWLKKVIHHSRVDKFFSANHRTDVFDVVFQNRSIWLYNITNCHRNLSRCIRNLPLEKDTPLVPGGVSFSSWKISYTPLRMPVYLYDIHIIATCNNAILKGLKEIHQYTISCNVMYVKGVERQSKHATRAHNVFAHNFLNIQLKVLES